MKRDRPMTDWEFKLFLLKIRLNIFWTDLINKIHRKRYCHRGFHKLNRGLVSVTTHQGDVERVEYLRCRYCQYNFFTTVEDRHLFERIKEENKESMEELWSIFSKTSAQGDSSVS